MQNYTRQSLLNCVYGTLNKARKQGGGRAPSLAFLNQNHGEKRMSSNIRETVKSVQDELFYICSRLTPRDGRLYQAVKIFGEIIDFSAIVNYRALPEVDEKNGGNITSQQLEDMTAVQNLTLRNTSLDDFVEWLTIEIFGIIADKIDKHYNELSDPDCFSRFKKLTGRSIFKKAAKYLVVKTLNATTYHLEGDSILYIETADDFLALYFFTKDSLNRYIKTHLIG